MIVKTQIVSLRCPLMIQYYLIVLSPILHHPKPFVVELHEMSVLQAGMVHSLAGLAILSHTQLLIK